AKRVVLAREMPLEEIARLRDKTPPELEIEAFCHGAMCVSVSGRCLLSRYINGRDGNRGQCAQPCRWQWQLSLAEQPQRKFDIGEEEQGSYLLNADDLCTAPFIDKLIEAGVDSLKIEGRAKSFYYVASVVAAYRRALDSYTAARGGYQCPAKTLEELEKSSHRRYSPGFYLGEEKALQNTQSAQYLRGCEVTAVVESWKDAVAWCVQRGKYRLGEPLEALLPNGENVALAPGWIYDDEKQRYTQETPRALMRFLLPVSQPLPPGTILRRPL
ncbi:MAG: U32 family peptidase C-terminal domain-containing protein, partial [Oscillospiraceae bacterium]|nr:U32 family peptidase C-terminal domain-containing protein [Oscillospiraceae bacterium]